MSIGRQTILDILHRLTELFGVRSGIAITNFDLFTVVTQRVA